MIQPNSTGRTDLVSGTLRFTSAFIMMIDDDVPTMEVVQAYLEEAGYQKFIQVAEPSKAIHLLEENRPDILLLDLMMRTHVSGFDILSAVRQHPKFLRLPVIILTVSTHSEDKHKALDLGATDFLAKPVDPSELRLRMRNIDAVPPAGTTAGAGHALAVPVRLPARVLAQPVPWPASAHGPRRQ